MGEVGTGWRCVDDVAWLVLELVSTKVHVVEAACVVKLLEGRRRRLWLSMP